MADDLRVATCECPYHLWVEIYPPRAEVRCELCGGKFCKLCFAHCGHECDWSGGVTVEEPVRTSKPEGVPA